MTLRELIENIADNLAIDIQDGTLSKEAEEMLQQAAFELQTEYNEKGYNEPCAAEYLDQDASVWIAKRMREKSAN